MNLYEKIVVWLERQIPHSMSEPLPSQEKIVKIFETRHHLHCMSPIPTSVTLPSINLPIEIPVNLLLGCIYFMLSDEMLMKSENLIFPSMNDLSISFPYNGIYGEINSGLAYHSFQQTVEEMLFQFH